MNVGWRESHVPFGSDKTYYTIAQLSQQIADRIQLMSKTRRTDFVRARRLVGQIEGTEPQCFS